MNTVQHSPDCHKAKLVTGFACRCVCACEIAAAKAAAPVKAYFRKKPVLVSAQQWFPGVEVEGVITEAQKVRFAPGGGASDIADCLETGVHGHPKVGAIRTLEGWCLVIPGDWIITGIQGERYPCKPDIFAQTYERVDVQPAEVVGHG